MKQNNINVLAYDAFEKLSFEAGSVKSHFKKAKAEGMTFHLLSFKFAYFLEQQYARRVSKWNKINKLDLCRDTVSHQISAREVVLEDITNHVIVCKFFSQFVMARYSII